MILNKRMHAHKTQEQHVSLLKIDIYCFREVLVREILKAQSCKQKRKKMCDDEVAVF